MANDERDFDFKVGDKYIARTADDLPWCYLVTVEDWGCSMTRNDIPAESLRDAHLLVGTENAEPYEILTWDEHKEVLHSKPWRN